MAGRTKKKTVVLASGIFDLLHVGHIKFLEDAKKAGGENAKLVVIVARDSTVEKTKARPPIIPEEQRRMLVASLKVVDEATLGYENFDIGEVINNIKPDIIAFGYDQVQIEKSVLQYLAEHKLDIKTVRVGKFNYDDLDSSSKIRDAVVEKWRKRRGDHDI